MKIFKNIGVGISGGVDSAVAALILKKKGFQVHGVFMKNWDDVDEIGMCSAEKDFEDAEKVCQRLEIPLTRVSFIKQYWNFVFEAVLNDYQNGYTPNPDILCNKFIKFDLFYKHCIEVLNVDAIATGHYANTSFGPFLKNYSDSCRVKLLRPRDRHKDQTLFLSQVDENALRLTMFPLADLVKREVRDIATSEGLSNVAAKKDSTGICFIGKRNFQSFINEYIKPNRGHFLDLDSGRIVGEHNGVHHWTVGQRCKLIGYADAYFVYRKNVETNDIYVVKGTNHPALQSDMCLVEKPNWIFAQPEELHKNSILECDFRFQHTKSLVPCRIVKTGEHLMIILRKPLRALTAGQYGVFYNGEECLGSAKIIHVGPDLYFCGKSSTFNNNNNKYIQWNNS